MKSSDKPDFSVQGAVLQLGQTLAELRRGPRQTPRAEEIQAQVEQVLALIRKHPIRKLLGISQGVIADSDPLRIKAVAYMGWQMLGDQITALQVEAVVAVVGDPSEAPGVRTLVARDQLGKMVEEGIFEFTPSPSEGWSGRVVMGQPIFRWLSGGAEGRGGFLFARPQIKKDREKHPAIKAIKPKELFDKVNREVLGLSSQIKVLASRMALHVARVGLLKEGLPEQHLGQTVILLAGPSGSGKNFLTSRLMYHTGLPHIAYDCTALTSQGYVGDDLDSPYRLLVNASGGDVQAASGGIILFDEWDKKSASHGRDVSCLSIQQELLGRLQAVAPFLVGGKRQFDGRPFLFDGRATGYLLVIKCLFVWIHLLEQRPIFSHVPDQRVRLQKAWGVLFACRL